MGDDYTKLLNRQLIRHYKDINNVPEDLKPFIDMVNEAYNHYDLTKEMLDRSMEISTKELKQINNVLTESNEALDNFNHNVSHDLKTHAINTISLVKMLAKYIGPNPNEKVSSIINRLENTGNQFQKVINGFLKISDIDKQNGIDNSFINIEELFNETSLEFESFIIDDNLKLKYESLNVESILFNKEHLTSILRNLITNAVKYKKINVDPIVNISFNRYNQNDCSITVKDNGIGIDLEKHHKKLFKMFTRLDNTKNIEGSGAGLFIVKKMVNNHKGDIQVISKIGDGTTFIIKFENIIHSDKN